MSAPANNSRCSSTSVKGHSAGVELAAGTRLGEVNGAVLDRFGRIFVLDGTNRIFVLDSAGELLDMIPNQLPEVGQVELARFAIDDEGRLYFADIGAGSAGRLIIAQLEAPLWPAE